MTFPAAPGALLSVAQLPNLRDLGGWATTGGRTIRRGMVYRSTALAKVQPAALEDLRLRTVVDLRSAAERTARPDRQLPGATEIVADVMADATHALPANLPQLLADPVQLSQALNSVGTTGRSATELMAEAYRDMVRLESARSGYRTLFTALADPDGTPLLFHCTTGKDRTGWAAAVLLLLLGVDEADVRSEYLLTNAHLLPTFEPLLKPFADNGGDRAQLEAVLGVHPSYLDAGLDEMRSAYGTVENYVTHGLALDEATVEALLTNLLDG